MQKELQLVLSPKVANDEWLLKKEVAYKVGVSFDRINHVRQIRRSIDARKANVKINMVVEVYIDDSVPEQHNYKIEYQNVSNKKPVIVVGSGPAGMFAALRLIELGYKPIVLERGKDVKSRRKDLKKINLDNIVNPESNYCFGEGGAGTYSDGKLYTRSKKRGNVKRILNILIAHGAVEDIAVNSQPHIGTNKLPHIVEAIRESIINAGGEYLFDKKVNDFIIEGNKITGVKTVDGNTFDGEGVILATGHSARDIYELLHRKEIYIESKSFAMGVRLEHPQELIDSIQYHCDLRGPDLPAAAYKLVTQSNNRGVYSFCMCPGGFIVPSATAPDEVVVNGMSPSTRSNEFANSGMVVSLNPEDYKEYNKYGPLAGMYYQKALENAAFIAGGKTQAAPAQRMVDFIKGKVSNNLGPTSYVPGLTSVPMHEMLPSVIGKQLQNGFKDFGKKMHGFITNEAQVIGVESRTSSPVRIPRDKETLEHPQIKGLFPSGEGAGYAGGIVSAAVDGERCAEALVQLL
ncbi:MAG: FAD-binding protein [Ichthyobacteriaceae bacterium]|nr:FAD-binding protein [Ichthyobacteriaceae bacterium]